MHYVLMPVETINRELDNRLFLAGVLARPGRRVLVGSARRINRLGLSLKNAVYLGHHAYNTADNRRRYLEPMRRQNYGFVYLHEEGGIFAGDEQAWRQMLDFQFDYGLEHLGPKDAVCTWGQFQAEYFTSRLPAMSGRIHATGHPRFDLYKSRYRSFLQPEADAIRARHGRYVLVNTNLSYANYQGGAAGTFIPINGYQFEDDARRLWMVRYWKYHMEMLGAIVSLLHQLSQRMPQQKFIVRPHPSESAEFYRSAFNGVRNIVVEHSGPVGPWILAADALIHDGCTTAVEGYFLDKPLIKPELVDTHEFDIRIPNDLSLRCKTEDQVAEALAAVAVGRFQRHQVQAEEVAGRMMNNFSADAIEAVAAVVEQTAGRLGLDFEPIRDDAERLDVLESLRDSGRLAAKRLAGLWGQTSAEHAKFYGFAQAQVPDRIARVERILGKRLRLSRCSDQLLIVDAG